MVERTSALLDLDGLIDALGVAMADLSAGRALVPDRIGALVPEREGRLIAMPGYVPSLGALVSKLVSLFPPNAGTAVPTHQAVIAVFNAETGSPAAILDGTEITAARTGRMLGAVGAASRARGRFGAGRTRDGGASTLTCPCPGARAADP